MRQIPLNSIPQLQVAPTNIVISVMQRIFASTAARVLFFAIVGLALIVATAKALAALEGDLTVVAWVQAMGGLLSIVGAWLIGRNSEIAAARARDQQRRILIESIRTCAKEALDQFERMHRAFTIVNVNKNLFFRTYDAPAFEAPIRSLRTIPFHELGDYSLGKAILDLESILERTKRGFDECASLAQHLPEDGVIDTLSAMQHSTLLFNHAASVERRAAELLGVRPRA